MGRDVLLLYMSPKNPNYKTQTNEGVVRYLIKEKETPDCILALCSETVRKKAVVEMPDGSTCTTLEYFRDALRRVGIPEERLVVIEVPDSMDDEKKQFQAISQLTAEEVGQHMAEYNRQATEAARKGERWTDV